MLPHALLDATAAEGLYARLAPWCHSTGGERAWVPLLRDFFGPLSGQVAEVRPVAEAWLVDIASRLERGIVLIIDYGYPATELYGPRRMAGTLVTYRDHAAGDDPFDAIGRQDMTAHVDISALERVAHRVGLDELGSTTQARLLAELGLGELLSDLGRDPATSAEVYLAARASVVRLLDPRHLGGFRVLMFGRGIATEPPITGFRPSPVSGG